LKAQEVSLLFQFNFVGKLLGPKGNSMKRLQEDTMTKMAVLGRGSMKDKQKVTISINPLFLELDRNYEDFVYIF
jgi:KH domain-containing RNA-binding signal transduction-associated protein 3